MRSRAHLVGVAVLLVPLALGGCGTAHTAAPAATAAPAPLLVAASDGTGHAGHGAAAGGAGPVQLYAVQTGPLGAIATDGAGRLLYRSDADSASPSSSRCAGACVQTWHPLLVVPGEEPELLGVDPADVGRLDRPDGGRQLTLAGWPLYVRADDTGELTTAGANGADGTWFVVTPTGAKAAP
jgi:predicted lipoprotein with Yx(FWY)xxD motif